MVKLSKEVTTALRKTVKSQDKLEVSDKDTFILVYKEYKAVPKTKRSEITDALKEATAKVTESENTRKLYSRMFKLAYDYVDMKVICQFEDLEYTNISNLVKLFKYVDKHIKDKSKELRAKVMSVKEENMSPYRYNNNMSTLITTLKEEYKLKEQEGEFIFQDVFNMVQKSVLKMTDEQLESLEKVIEEAKAKLEVA